MIPAASMNSSNSSGTSGQMVVRFATRTSAPFPSLIKTISHLIAIIWIQSLPYPTTSRPHWAGAPKIDKDPSSINFTSKANKYKCANVVWSTKPGRAKNSIRGANAHLVPIFIVGHASEPNTTVLTKTSHFTWKICNGNSEKTRA